MKEPLDKVLLGVGVAFGVVGVVGMTLGEGVTTPVGLFLCTRDNPNLSLCSFSPNLDATRNDGSIFTEIQQS